jgi:aminodeoxyfutalosine deaminase
MDRASELRAFVTALPKAELHVHLEGSIAPELACTLAARHGLPLPGDERGPAGVREAFRFDGFGGFIRAYLAISRCLRTVDDLRDAIGGLAARLAAQNVRHAEVTFTPITHVAMFGTAIDTLHAGLLEGRAAAADRGVSIAFVLDIVRSFLDQAEPTLDFALTLHEHGAVAGLGLAGPEGGDHPYAPLADTFARAKAAGLRSLPHAGELLGPHSIRAALEVIGADRIGHGIRCVEDPALVEELARRKVPLEVCPSSNVALAVVPSLADHPLPRLLDAGLELSLATDDPALFGVELVEEYLRCADAFALDAPQLRALAAASLRHAVVDDAQRSAWLAELAAVPDPA